MLTGAGLNVQRHVGSAHFKVTALVNGLEGKNCGVQEACCLNSRFDDHSRDFGPALQIGNTISVKEH